MAHIGVGMLYLVNCADEDIREAIWGMINTTVSIFCAATFDNAFFRTQLRDVMARIGATTVVFRTYRLVLRSKTVEIGEVLSLPAHLIASATGPGP